ncbi:MAG: TatD family hydrolase, partial [Christensenellaceae bacterium]|nr:TatD family hydrolase [Christensenellaceae bacterium]
SVETAKILLDRGLYLGIGGSLTFKNAVKAVEVVKYAPLDRLLLETDSPYLSPVPLRGKRNDPANTRLVAARVAELRKTDIEEVAEQMFENGKKLFGI